MPLYEYQCDACGGRIERIRKFSDPPLEDPCPTCGGHLTKLLSSPAIQFKGAGWYVNDYAKSGSSKSEKGDKSDSSPKADSSKSESKTDKTDSSSKPAESSAKSKSE